MRVCRRGDRNWHPGAVISVLGDLGAVEVNLLSDAVVLAEPGASLGEVTAWQVPRLVGQDVSCVVVCPGLADLLAGHDESRVHAEVVALCDALARVARQGSLVFRGFPQLSGRGEEVRLIDAAARVTCELRGISWQPYGGRGDTGAGQA